MPEGDTVFRTARSLDRALGGGQIVDSDFRIPQLATVDLSGQTVLEVVPRGKHMFTRTNRGVSLHTHLKMTGTWRIFRTTARWSGGPDHEVRVVLRTEGWVAVGYRIPVIEIMPTRDEHLVVGHLGPDVLGPDWDLQEALSRIASAGSSCIAEALLDQRNLAGIGNLYCNETLFLRGLHPATPVAASGDIAATVSLARRLMMHNRDHWQQVTTGDTRKGREHWVFERVGKPCRRCTTTIEIDEIGSRHPRLSYWCPSCQPQRQSLQTAATRHDDAPS